MLVFGIILLLIGAVTIYLGRPRERWIVYAGAIIFLLGLVFIVIWLIDASGADTNSVNAALFAPVAWILRKVADKLDEKETIVVPNGSYVFWSFAPTPSSAQWQQPSSTNRSNVDL